MENSSSANTRFGLNLFRLISRPDSNAFISPFSLSVALSMTQLGAGGETAQGMAKTLCWEENNEAAIHDENHKYVVMLRKPREDYILSSANRLYVEEGLSVLPEFLQQTQKLYLAEAVPAKFKANPEKERVSINDWVSEQTKDKIKDLLAPGILDTETRMVLVNAIYFKGLWENPFDALATSPRLFKVSQAKEKHVPTMMAEKKFSFWMDDGKEGFSALELPYKGGELSMVILLPTSDFGLVDVEKTLSLEKLNSLFSRLQNPAKIKLSLPKFEITCSYGMKKPLCQLGMSVAFDELLADFSRMTKANDLCVSEVVHKAFVTVNEEGSEAAAATAVVMMTRCLRIEVVPSFTADHPFLFVIRDKRASNCVLFMGRVVDPSV